MFYLGTTYAYLIWLYKFLNVNYILKLDTLLKAESKIKKSRIYTEMHEITLVLNLKRNLSYNCGSITLKSAEIHITINDSNTSVYC